MTSIGEAEKGSTKYRSSAEMSHITGCQQGISGHKVMGNIRTSTSSVGQVISFSFSLPLSLAKYNIWMMMCGSPSQLSVAAALLPSHCAHFQAPPYMKAWQGSTTY